MENVVIETIESYNKYLEKLPYGIEQIINSILLENYSLAKEDLINLLEGLLWTIEVNTKLEDFNYFADIEKDKIDELLNEIISGLQVEDYNLCSDILKYELLELVKQMGKYNTL